MQGKRGICCRPRCTRRAAKGKRGLCHTCYSREWRAANPLQNAYNGLKQHAKARGKFFDLSFADFRTFAVRLDYLSKAGTAADAFHIDRIDEQGGYTPGNIQLLPNRANVKKYQEFRRAFVRDLHGHAWMTKAQAGL